MLGLTHLARALLLLRCLFSADARQEFHIYRENTHPVRMVVHALSALIGLCVLSYLCLGLYYAVLIFYHLATTGQAVP